VNFMCGFMWVLWGRSFSYALAHIKTHIKRSFSLCERSLCERSLCACAVPARLYLACTISLLTNCQERDSNPWLEQKGQERVRHWFKKVHAKNRKTYHASRQRKSDLPMTNFSRGSTNRRKVSYRGSSSVLCLPEIEGPGATQALTRTTDAAALNVNRRNR
jgi:hypothetical protein